MTDEERTLLNRALARVQELEDTLTAERGRYEVAILLKLGAGGAIGVSTVGAPSIDEVRQMLEACDRLVLRTLVRKEIELEERARAAAGAQDGADAPPVPGYSGGPTG